MLFGPSAAKACDQAGTAALPAVPYTYKLALEHRGFGSLLPACSHCQIREADPSAWGSAGSTLRDALWAVGFIASQHCYSHE